ncbi:MAG: nucleotidyltransferase family protein [Elusimicrobia bacterium]|nr:nucleotidyltransferase family protein [Elusimicrobiota bacterium]
MKAMVLAAGVGSRLRPLTDSTPKALLEVGGVTLLERAVRALAGAGADGVIVNTFHLADRVEAFLRSKDFGVPVKVSREDALLDTGGGIAKAAWFLDDGEPFLVRNVDILSELDLRAFYKAHAESGALATLAVRERPSKRRLLFAADGRLLGREGESEAPPAGLALAFDGIHALSPEIFRKLPLRGAFSMTAAYLRLAASGETIRAYRADASRWEEVGTPERLEEARRRASDTAGRAEPRR